MPSLPNSSGSLLVRTDFSDDSAWHAVSAAAVAVNSDGFQAYVTAVDDRGNEAVTWQSLRDAVPDNDHGASVLFIVDESTIASPDRAILAVDVIQHRLHGTEHEPFRCIPSELWSVANNLNIANMDWADFAGHTGDDGVFRGL